MPPITHRDLFDWMYQRKPDDKAMEEFARRNPEEYVRLLVELLPAWVEGEKGPKPPSSQ